MGTAIRGGGGGGAGGPIEVVVFNSYAHADGPKAGMLARQLAAQQRISRRYRYRAWRDTAILIGQDWRREIGEALKVCDAGLLFISAHFLGSEFITQVELRRLLAPKQRKIILPVLLRPVDFARQDMKGLEALQIYRYPAPFGGTLKAYSELRGPREREAFAQGLFAAIEARLDRHFRGG